MTTVEADIEVASLVYFASCLGLRVEFHDNLDVAGRYHNDLGLIQVFIGLPSSEHVMILAHEIGHHIGYLKHPGGESRDKRLREREAYAYGWHVLRGCGSSVTRQQWLAECREASYWRSEAKCSFLRETTGS